MKQNNYKQSFSFFIILNSLGISVPEDAAPIINYSFGVFILSLLILFSYLNSIFSIFSLYYLTKFNVDEKLVKYPKLKKLIKYYEGSSLLYIFIEITMGLIFILIIIFSSLSMLGIIFYFK
jgi:hypothetical protein